MKKLLFVSACFLMSSICVNAQKGTVQIGAALDVGLPTGDFKGEDGDGFNTGFGGHVRGLFGVSSNGQITATMGYSSFKYNGSTSTDKITMGISPFMAGYRHNMNGFYLEPQIGIATYKMKATVSGLGSGSTSKTAFTYAAGIGYAIKGVDIGVRYQAGSVKFDEADESINMTLIGIRVGYNFMLPKRK